MSNITSDISLKTLRAQHSLSQAQVARLAGSTQQQISRVERGSELPSLLLAAHLAAIFQVPVEQLFPTLFARIHRQTERRWKAFNRLRRRNQPYVPGSDSITVLTIYPSIRRLGRAVFEAPATG